MAKTYRLSVVTDRGFENYSYVKKVLDNFIEYFGEFEYIYRGLNKCDLLGMEYAKKNYIEIRNALTEPTWNKNMTCKSFIKSKTEYANERLIDELMTSGYVPYLIVFWNGEDDLTANLIEMAKSKNRRLWLIVYDFDFHCIFSNCTD